MKTLKRTMLALILATGLTLVANAGPGTTPLAPCGYNTYYTLRFVGCIGCIPIFEVVLVSAPCVD